MLAGTEDSAQAAAALEQLCRAYWFPLYTFARRRGNDAEASRDLTQGFFADLMERQALGRVTREGGKFRSFLLGSFKHFLSDQWDKERRLKRGGGREIISLDGEPADERYQLEPRDDLTPERHFERRWAQAVLEQVAARMREECRAAGTEERFDALKDLMMGNADGDSYDAAARRLGLSVSAVTSALHRLRTRFRELFREEIAQTVASPADVDEEIRYLISVLAG